MGMDAKAYVWFGPKSRELTEEEYDRHYENGGDALLDVPDGLLVGTVYYDGADSLVFLATEEHRFDWDYGDQEFTPAGPDAAAMDKLVQACATHGFDPETIGWHCLCNYS